MLSYNQTPSIASPLIYRMTDQEPDKIYDAKSENVINARVLYQQIRENLESILNSRAPSLDWSTEYTELAQSILNYGTMDFTHHYFGQKRTQQALCRQIQKIISYFEPRLKSVQVIALDSNLEVERTLKLRIEAVIQVDAEPISAVFESDLQVESSHFNFDQE